MDQLPFHREELDLIWSEGAIYNIGFERGLKEWKEFLKPGGYVAISEARVEIQATKVRSFRSIGFLGILSPMTQLIFLARQLNSYFSSITQFIF